MTQKTDVIILGAGLAGLSSALTLSKLNPEARFLLLEARDRVGGRVHTLNNEMFHALDIGASWLHNYWTNPLTDLGTLKALN